MKIYPDMKTDNWWKIAPPPEVGIKNISRQDYGIVGFKTWAHNPPGVDTQKISTQLMPNIGDELRKEVRLVLDVLPFVIVTEDGGMYYPHTYEGWTIEEDPYCYVWAWKGEELLTASHDWDDDGTFEGCKKYNPSREIYLGETREEQMVPGSVEAWLYGWALFVSR